MNKWKVGDWCFFEFELYQIQECNEEIVGEVTNGCVACSGKDLSDRCFPLDLRIKVISEEFYLYSDKIHKLNYNSLNIPDIHRYMVNLWVDTCNHKDNNEFIKNNYSILKNLYNKITESIDNVSKNTFDNVMLFKERK